MRRGVFRPGECGGDGEVVSGDEAARRLAGLNIKRIHFIMIAARSALGRQSGARGGPTGRRGILSRSKAGPILSNQLTAK